MPHSDSSLARPNRFAVAFSFSGKNRDEVSSLANAVAKVLSRDLVLFDDFFEEEFAIPNLDVKLPELYRDSDIVVIALSESYFDAKWTNLEWRQIRQLINEREEERVMLLKLDGVDLSNKPGLTSGDGFVDISNMNSNDVADLILRRWLSVQRPSLLSRATNGKAKSESNWKCWPVVFAVLGMALLFALVLIIWSPWYSRITLNIDSFRDPCVYHVRLSSAPPDDAGYKYIPSEHYLFYSARVDYTRRPPWQGDSLLLAIITKPSSYAGWIESENVVYREIVGFRDEDRHHLDEIENQIKNSDGLAEKLNALERLARVSVKVNGQELVLNEFTREPFGFVLSYLNPLDGSDLQSAQYEFTCATFQPRTQRHFPFGISEYFKNLDYRIDFREAGISEPEYFSAFLFDSGQAVRVEMDEENGVLTAKSSDNSWVHPGGGVVLFWE